MANIRLSAPRAGVRHMRKRNYRSMSSGDFLMAINAEELSKVFLYDDINVIHNIVVQQITAALNVIAPYKTTAIKDRPTPLNLKPDGGEGPGSQGEGLQQVQAAP